MRKLLSFLVLLLIPALNYADSNYSKGENLQVLYQRVWAYENPDDVSTRVGPFGYSSKITFMESDSRYPGFIKVKTAKGSAYYVDKDFVGSAKEYGKDKLSREIKEGKRYRSQYARFNLYKYNPLSIWPTLGVSAVILFILYMVWKRFYKIDQWFYRRSAKRKSVLYKPWFISYSLLSGLVIGAFLTFFAPTESEWFLYEGFRLWGDFPSTIDWILWAAVMLLGITLITGMINPFIRFSAGTAALYSAFALFLMIVYFITGILTGGIVAAIMLFAGFGGGKGSSGSSSEGNTVYDPSRSERWNKVERFYN